MNKIFVQSYSSKSNSHENQLPLKKECFLLQKVVSSGLSQANSARHGHQRLACTGADKRVHGAAMMSVRRTQIALAALIRKWWELFSLKSWLIMNLCLHWIGINWCIISVYNTETKSKSLHLNGFSFMFIHEIYSSAQPVPKHPFNSEKP